MTKFAKGEKASVLRLVTIKCKMCVFGMAVRGWDDVCTCEDNVFTWLAGYSTSNIVLKHIEYRKPLNKCKRKMYTSVFTIKGCPKDGFTFSICMSNVKSVTLSIQLFAPKQIFIIHCHGNRLKQIQTPLEMSFHLKQICKIQN